MEAEKNEWKKMALDAMRNLENNTNIAMRAAEKLTPSGDNIVPKS
jgi:hypothetical protein